jgi:polyhydroxybutyrate depolymerase
MSTDRAGRARLLRRLALLGLVVASVLAASLSVPVSPAPAASAASAGSPTTTPPTTTTSQPVPVSASPGCANAVPARSGTTFQAASAGGDVGAYIRQLPSRYTGRSPMPVVMELHGYGVSAIEMALVTQLGPYGNRNGFITITPQITRSIPYWQTSSNGRDVAFLLGVLAKVTSTLCVDLNRIYVTGYSNGAIMASVLACVDAGQVAAIAPVSGVANPAGCNPSRPVPVVAFHGTADPLVRYTGGLGPVAYTLPLPAGTRGTISQLLGPAVPQSTSGPSIPSITSAWAKRDGCASKPTTRVVARNVALISYTCPGTNAVQLYRIRGGGHTWPGSALSAKATNLGATTMAINADKIMWNFFMAHPLHS